MKRTNLVLDEALLKEAVKELGAKTYSEAVNMSLKEMVRQAKVMRIPELLKHFTWEGDLAEMREDNPRRAPKSRKKKAA
ncbi:MAG: type II toxin-antitoxin system VapB family antitoxin [Bryobacteraceae bacterium]|nr:type II toxin-antitoxin system VapB family antitoxin [Bryobacteraceae bacterium]